MTWFAFHGYQDINAGGAEEKELVSAGFHGYATKAQADANANSVNVFQGMLLDSLHIAHITNPLPGGALSHVPVIGGISTGIETIGGFLGKLGEANTWLRIGEFLLGVILIGVGVAKLTGTDNFISNAASRIPVVPV